MKLRIGVMHTLPSAQSGEAYEYNIRMNDLIHKNMDMVRSEGTEITFQFPRLGLDGFGAFQYAYMNALNDIETLRGYMDMNESGDFDAVIGWCFYDPMMLEGRQVLDVPLIGPAEVCMKTATMMGTKFGIVTTSQKTEWVVKELVHKYRLEHECAGVKGIRISFQDQIDALDDARANIDGFIEVARELIADGAEVLIPGCMLADTCLRMVPGCEDEYPNGLTHVDGVPILNVTSVVLLEAEKFAKMKVTETPWISRKLFYNTGQDDPESQKEASRLMEYSGPGFWRDGPERGTVVDLKSGTG